MPRLAKSAPTKVPMRPPIRHHGVALMLGVALLLKLTLGLPAQVWIGAMEPEWRKARGWPENDFMSLFSESAPWPKAAAKVNVFLITKKFAIEAPDDEVKKLIDNLKARHIALALQGVPLVATDACGRSIESYGPPHHMEAAAQRIKRLGGNIEYIALDEPLYFGHAFDGNANLHACHSPVDKLAEQTVASMNDVRKVFPDVKVGDVEPFPVHHPDARTWIANLTEWWDAYKKYNGAPFAFFQADLVRTTPDWRNQFEMAVAVVRRDGIPLGVIYDGQPTDNSDEQWTANARTLCRTVEGQMRVTPDLVIFQTWTDRPRKMLPDTADGSLTNLVARYERGCP
jgi:hypothetical protein